MIETNIENNLDIKEIKTDIKKEYQQILEDFKKEEKSKDSDTYFYIQILLAFIIVALSFFIRQAGSTTFEYAKANYRDFFEKETVLESNFSYNIFLGNMQEEIRIAFDKLSIAYEEAFAKGSGIPSNASYAKYDLDIQLVTPVEGWISSSFGSRADPFGSSSSDFHTGLDVAAEKGTFIKSATDGIVVGAEYSPIAGNFIVIQNDEELSLMYGHTQFMLVNVGDSVLAGQVIATVGETGMATGPHLHFEVRINDIRYNPIYALS